MFQDKKIAVVVPAYNEERLLGRVISTAPDFVDKIVVVDDASTDRTEAIARSFLTAQPERIVLLQHEQNQGVGGAIATGYKWCRDNDIDVAVVMAGDAQMDPDDLPSLLKPVVEGEVDYTKGNRLITGEAWKKIPRVRYLGNAALSLLTKIASGYWRVADSQSGYTAINKRALETIDWDKMHKRYGQPNDLLVRLNVHGFRVKDIPVKPVYNIGEKSGIRLWKVVPLLSILLLKLFLWRMLQKYVIRDFHPLIFFYFSGILLQIVSLLLFGRMLIVWATTGSIPRINSLMFVFTVIASLQFLFFAMWFDMDYNRYLSEP